MNERDRPARSDLGATPGAPGIEPEPAAAAAVFGERIGLAREYVALLAGDGVVRGLIGPREAGRLWTRHVLNCAVVGSLLASGSRVVDVGTGAGLPGIPLAIARPDVRVDLVEPLERRTVFLSEVVSRLGLTGCRVVRGRAQDVIGTVGGADVVTSRAVAPLGKLAGWSAPLVRSGGLVLALKGATAADEVERDGDELRAVGLSEVSVQVVGVGVVDPPTHVVRGMVTPRDRPSTGRSGARRPHPA